jgi:ANTAR domain-containing protein
MTSALLSSTSHRPRASDARTRSQHRPAPLAQPSVAVAALLADAAERLADATNVAELWSLLVEEAFAFFDADGVAVLERRGQSWVALVSRLAGGTPADQTRARMESAAQRGLLTDPGERTDPDCPGGWQSLLVAALDRRPSRVVTRLIWFADRPGAFVGGNDRADLLARHAGIAVRAVTTRESLGEAVSARQRVGQAVGILMARYRITADPAMALLRHRSQHTNIKLRDIADEVILTGELPE